MKDNKGFTLIEIIITITLIALVSIMFTNSFDSISKNSRRSDYTRMIKKIKNAVSVYVENNNAANSELYAGSGYILVTVGDLITSGNLSNELIDPSTQKVINKTNSIYVIRDEYGSITIDYPHENGVANECFLETTPLIVSKSTSASSLYYLNLNNIGLRLIKTDGSTTSLVSNSTIIVTSNNIVANTIGTYTISYKYVDCADSSIWRLGTRKVIFY